MLITAKPRTLQELIDTYEAERDKAKQAGDNWEPYMLALRALSRAMTISHAGRRIERDEELISLIHDLLKTHYFPNRETVPEYALSLLPAILVGLLKNPS